VVDALMKKLALLAALILAASPVAAQVATSGATSNDQGVSAGGTQSASSQAATTGVICAEEMTATFCNVTGAPSNGGYGSGSVTTGSSAPPAATPLCPDFPPANELCY
jgi:hypothetical protein